MVVRSVLFTGTAFYSGFDNQGTNLASPFRSQVSARGPCAAALGGTAAHNALGAPTSGADRIYFGVVAEVKTRAGVPDVSVFFNAIEQAESCEPGRPAVVTVLAVLNGVKYFVRRGP